jgi:hypothetical protein
MIMDVKCTAETSSKVASEHVCTVARKRFDHELSSKQLEVGRKFRVGD